MARCANQVPVHLGPSRHGSPERRSFPATGRWKSSRTRTEEQCCSDISVSWPSSPAPMKRTGPRPVLGPHDSQRVFAPVYRKSSKRVLFRYLIGEVVGPATTRTAKVRLAGSKRHRRRPVALREVWPLRPVCHATQSIRYDPRLDGHSLGRAIHRRSPEKKSRTGWTRHTYSRGGTFVLDILPSNRMRSTAAFSASQTPPIFCRGEACPPRSTHYSGDLLATLPSDSRTRRTPRTSPSPSSSQTYKGVASASRSWRLSGRVRTTRAPRSFRTYARQIRATVT